MLIPRDEVPDLQRDGSEQPVPNVGHRRLLNVHLDEFLPFIKVHPCLFAHRKDLWPFNRSINKATLIILI